MVIILIKIIDVALVIVVLYIHLYSHKLQIQK